DKPIRANKGLRWSAKAQPLNPTRSGWHSQEEPAS
ncbi:Hypothetical protein, partial CDS, partial [Neorhizobium galegae bv. orientalis]